MRVVHLMKVVRIAGAERHLLVLCDGLRQRGIDAQIVLMVEPDKPMDDMAALAAQRGIPLQRVLIRRHADPQISARLRDALRILQPDIVHTHLLHADWFGTLAARWAGVRTVLTTRHNDDAFRRRRIMRLIHRGLWRATSGGIAISQALAWFCIDVEGAPPSKVQTIYYGLEPLPPHDPRALRDDARAALAAARSLPVDGLFVGIACRLIEQKGVVYGLRAFAQIADRFPNAHLLIAGDGPLRGALSRETHALGLTNRVHFLGWLEDVPRLLWALDVMLMPSLWEGFGLIALEAMAARTPIIASRVSALPEVVADGETGLLVPPRDVPALAHALTTLLSDGALRAHLGLVAEDRLETRFTAARMVDETAALYARVLRR